MKAFRSARWLVGVIALAAVAAGTLKGIQWIKACRLGEAAMRFQSEIQDGRVAGVYAVAREGMVTELSVGDSEIQRWEQRLDSLHWMGDTIGAADPRVRRMVGILMIDVGHERPRQIELMTSTAKAWRSPLSAEKFDGIFVAGSDDYGFCFSGPK